MLAKIKVNLHPQTTKHMNAGHPWVTEDSFTKKFPLKEKFLLGVCNDKNTFNFLLHDPLHKKIKGRLWKSISSEDAKKYSHESFWSDFNKRVEDSLKKRQKFIQQGLINRENFYLIFGESDFLPGLFLQKLQNHYVLSLYTNFWDEFLANEIKTILINSLKAFFPTAELYLWAQMRNKKQEKNLICLTHPELKDFDFTLIEYDLKYKIRLNSYYDVGIYTDMSALRPIILKKFKEINNSPDPKLLNLFSYTSAYSLYFLNNGFKEALSVDLSKKYLDWSLENFNLNPGIVKNGNYHSLCLSTQEALKKLRSEQKKYDLIISDPPSASSDGEKKNTAYQFYDEEFISLTQLLAPKGLLVLFINTHTISRKKFEEKINSLISQNHLSEELEIVKRVSLELDCPTLKGFIEGDYLKGILVAKKG